MGVLIAIVIVSYIIGRITIIENLVYKSNTGIYKYTIKNKFLFFILFAIKVSIAIAISSFFVPADEITKLKAINSSSSFLTNYSEKLLTYEMRIVACTMGVLIGDFMGIWKMRD